MIVLAFCICSASRVTPATWPPVPAPPQPVAAAASPGPAPASISMTPEIASGGSAHATRNGLALEEAEPMSGHPLHVVRTVVLSARGRSVGAVDGVVGVGQLDADRRPHGLDLRDMATDQP